MPSNVQPTRHLTFVHPFTCTRTDRQARPCCVSSGHPCHPRRGLHYVLDTVKPALGDLCITINQNRTVSTINRISDCRSRISAVPRIGIERGEIDSNYMSLERTPVLPKPLRSQPEYFGMGGKPLPGSRLAGAGAGGSEYWDWDSDCNCALSGASPPAKCVGKSDQIGRAHV